MSVSHPPRPEFKKTCRVILRLINHGQEHFFRFARITCKLRILFFIYFFARNDKAKSHEANKNVQEGKQG